MPFCLRSFDSYESPSHVLCMCVCVAFSVAVHTVAFKCSSTIVEASDN